MSPNNPGNFVNDLVEMASAFKRLPEVEAELADVRQQAAKAQDTIQRLEMKLMERSNEISMHLARIRSLEVERDDAQFHALEADDRTQRALDFIKATFGNAGALIQALEPPAAPKPEQADTSVPVQAVQSAAEPRAIDNPIYCDPQAPFLSTDDGKPEPSIGEVASAPLGEPHIGAAIPTSNASPDGVSSADGAASTSTDAPSAPEVAAQPGEPATATSSASEQVATVETPTASQSDTAHNAATPPDAPTVDPSQKPVGIYTGRRYSDVVKGGSWPTREQWEAGGGTVDNWFA